MTRYDITTETIAAAYHEGESVNAIARRLECTAGLVVYRLKKAGLYNPTTRPQPYQHGTRSMYERHGCRCYACCKAEHESYLKRQTSKSRRRQYSKYDDNGETERPYDFEAKRKQYEKRKNAISSSPRAHSGLISWKEIAEEYKMKCAKCGRKVDPGDRWVNESGRHCFGRNYPTVDHIKPLSKGGADTFDNVQLLCKHCNSQKRDLIEVIA